MMNKLFSIKDNVVVITGGTGVLGRTIAEYLAQEGAKVIILGRKEEVGHEMFLNLLPNISGDRNAFSFEKQK
jgi:NAD(P)-dependent dehydrogenase (short-subunit alcohol dehydrogenase family)